MGFLKKVKETAEKAVDKGTELGKKGIEKGTEVGTKAYDGAKEAAEKGRNKAREEKKNQKTFPFSICQYGFIIVKSLKHCK